MRVASFKYLKQKKSLLNWQNLGTTKKVVTIEYQTFSYEILTGTIITSGTTPAEQNVEYLITILINKIRFSSKYFKVKVA